MKKLFRIFIISILFLNMQMISAHSETFKLIEEKLGDLGISEEYTDNIINYINDLDLSDEEVKGILEDSKSVFSNIKDTKGYEDFTFSELVNIYGKALNIANDLNISINVDFSNKEIELIDKKSNLTLFKCDVNDAKKYYESYKEKPITSEEYNQLISYISESVDRDSNESNSYDSYLNDEIRIDEKANSNESDSEISENTNVKNTSNDSDNILNKTSTTRSKNINRTLSIIYIILFFCVIFSILLGVMFKDKEKNR